MKIAFAGTPEFAAVALRSLLAARFDVGLVLTQPDRAAGRGMQLQASPVKQVAQAANIPVAQPEKLRTAEQQAALVAYAPDVLVVAAYGLILPQSVLDLPRYGCLNIHASLLPRWRGAAPIHRAIEAGDHETGITIMQMDAGLDTGAMLTRCTTPILAADTTTSLHDRLAELGGEMIVEALQTLPYGTLTAQAQPTEGVTYAHKIAKSESALDFRQTAEILARRLRAFDPFPGGTAQVENDTLKIWAAQAIASNHGDDQIGQILAVDEHGIVVACSNGALRLSSLQKAGGKRLDARTFLQGFTLKAGMRFKLPTDETSIG